MSVIKCEICLENEVSDFISIPGCNHKFCRNCLTIQISNNIKGSRLPYCPSVNPNIVFGNQQCNHLIAENIVQENAGDLLKEYEFIKVEVSIPPEERFYCPVPTCTYPLSKPIAIQESENKSCYPKFDCPKCENQLCLVCKMIWHNDTSCEAHQLTELFFEVSSPVDKRNCPSCLIKYERVDGCAHITCPKCKAQFCDLCENIYANGQTSCNCDVDFDLMWEDEQDDNFEGGDNHQFQWD